MNMKQQFAAEAKFLKLAEEWLDLQAKDGIKVLRINDNYHRGYSDLFICARGRLICAELKASTGTASQHQIDFIRIIQKAGGQAGVCRSFSEIKDLIDAALYCTCRYEESIVDDMLQQRYKYCPMCGGELIDARRGDDRK